MDDRFDEIVSDAARDLWERDHPFSGAEKDVLLERAKQRDQWGDEHDDRHTDGLLANLAADHIMRPRTDRRRQLVIAAALCIAEIERLDRLEAREGREETDHE